MQGTVQRERPLGITILAVLAIIGGIFLLLGGLALLALGGVAASQGDSVSGALGGFAAILGIVTLVLAILYLAFGVGAWMLKPWAWTLGVVSQVLSLLIALVQIILGSSITGQIVGIIISAVILYYLFTPNVKAAFGKA
jgi:hypothetical protein